MLDSQSEGQISPSAALQEASSSLFLLRLTQNQAVSRKKQEGLLPSLCGQDKERSEEEQKADHLPHGHKSSSRGRGSWRAWASWGGGCCSTWLCGMDSAGSRELNCTLEHPWGAHMQGSRGMQAEPLSVLTAAFRCLMSCVMSCVIWPSTEKRWDEQSRQCFPTDETLLCRCVIFLQSSFSFFTVFILSEAFT